MTLWIPWESLFIPDSNGASFACECKEMAGFVDIEIEHAEETNWFYQRTLEASYVH